MKALVRQEEQFVTGGKGERVGVLLHLKTHDRLREAGEELADVRTYDAARSKFVSLAKAAARPNDV